MPSDLSNKFRLDGKIIVITGAAGLLGQKHAEAVAAYGGVPVLLDLLLFLKFSHYVVEQYLFLHMVISHPNHLRYLRSMQI